MTKNKRQANKNKTGEQKIEEGPENCKTKTREE